MSVEYEVKIIDIEEKSVKTILKKIGAKKEYSKRKFNRTIFKLNDGFVRVRSEGDKVTMTCKTKNELPINFLTLISCRFPSKLVFKKL